MKILVVDDNATNRAIFTALIRQMGHSVSTAEDGHQAVATYERDHPDLILMDIVMPVLDGLQAIRQIKALDAKNKIWTPVIIITGKDSVDDVVMGLDAGADDYLTKPVDNSILRAKIRSMQYGVNWQRELNSKSVELERYHFAAKEERRIAAHLMYKMTDAVGLRDPALEYWLSPTEDCSGDLIAAARTPGGTLHVLLADGTGHGLTAAINVLPLPSIFYSMTAKGFNVGRIAAELNARIKSLLPTDRFIAATIVSLDPREKVIDVWNGGNPDALVIGKYGKLLQSWKSTHLPLGILSDKDFDASTRSYHFDEDVQFVMMSDGLCEARDRDHRQYGVECLLDILSTAEPDKRMERVKQDLASHLGQNKAHDDVSLLFVNTALLAQEDGALSSPDAEPSKGTAGHWRVSLMIGSHQLRNLDSVPFTLDTLKRLGVGDAHLGNLFLIISELINNALDHGLLGLDSALKNEMDGFGRYLEEREKRLSALNESATMEMDFEHLPKEGSNLLRIRVQDSGKGFDHNKLISSIKDTDAKHGRGIALVKSLVEEMQFNAQGNEITVDYLM